MKRGEMLSRAIRLATTAHDGQFDRSGQPYVLHVLKVMHYCKTENEELQCIAVLHDIVEDCDVTYEDLRSNGFSDRVVDGVRALTKQRGQSYEEYKQAVFANADAMHVKLADLRHNSDIRRLKGVTQKDIERTARYYQFSLEIQDKLRNA